ncbi:MAG: hypothetical protein K0Q53_613 [Massilibacillus sp.]|nr:hypothetical protein [Massilibacillus sp.]
MAIANMIKKETPPVLKFLAVKQKKPITLATNLKTPNKKKHDFHHKKSCFGLFLLAIPKKCNILIIGGN